MRGDARRGERGVALIVVLWVLVLLSMIAGTLIAEGRTEARLARNQRDRAVAEAAADAGVYSAILMLLDPRTEKRWRSDGSTNHLTFAGHALTVSVQDEHGKIDLNTASDALLLGLFQSAGLSPDAAATMVDRIVDWRTPGDLHRLNGAKEPEYRSAGYAYGPRNAPFESVSELRLVMGMTPELYDRVAPALTVYSGAQDIDPAAAPPQALAALPGMSDERLAALLKARADGLLPTTLSVVSMTDATLAGRAFAIRSEVGDGNRRFAVVRMTGDLRRPYWVLLWANAIGGH
jgi:general secretion pathway protein K